MITLNLLSPHHKSALRARIIYAMIERLMIIFVVATLTVTISLLVIKGALTRNLSSALSRQILSTEYASTNSETKRLNLAIGRIELLQQAVMPISALNEDIIGRTIAGVALSRIDYDVKSSTLRLDGDSDTRDHLLAYEEALRASPYVKSVESPISNLFQKADIHFSIQVQVDAAAVKKALEPQP